MGELELVLRLVASAAVIGGAGWTLRRWTRRAQAGTGGGIRVVSRTGVTRGAMVAVVDIADRRFLVGASEQGVNLLAELDRTKEEVAATPPVEGASADITAAAVTADDAAAVPAADIAAAVPAADIDLTDLSIEDLAHGSSGDPNRPRTGLADRLRRMTVRSYVDRPAGGNVFTRP